MTMGETAEEKPVRQLNRVIVAPSERVFTAWTTPDTSKVWSLAHEVSAFDNREANTGKPRAQIWNPQKQNMANSVGMNW